MKKYISLFSAIALLIWKPATAQQADSTRLINLTEISVSEKLIKNEVERMPEVNGMTICAGKKNELIHVTSLDADLSTNNSRQIFGKVPGVSIWESDGSGIQTGIATRGLSPNRSWEFNVRQNGYDISSEVFGYPEAYFTPPSEAVSSIEIVRGAASLQFGPQFGGLLNYVIKKGDPNKKIAVEVQQTRGSYGLYDSYTGIGGTIKKFSYYGYFHHRNADGWRENSRYNITTGYLSMGYRFSDKVSLSFDYTHMDYVSQQPGGLTDSLFNVDPQRSLRSRNWMSAPWNVGSLNLDVQFNESNKLNVKLFGLYSSRNSIGFMSGITVADTFNASLRSYNYRQADRDDYENYGAEIRYLKTYKFRSVNGTLATGVRSFMGTTMRKQLGNGNAGTEYDMSIVSVQNRKPWRRELEFGTDNYAIFAENLFTIGKFGFTPGFRYEIINSSVEGFIDTTTAGILQPRTQKRDFFLLGLGAEYHVSEGTEIYANYSQSYRPVTFSELTPSATTDVIDPSLKDANGYQIDGGYRGKVKDFLNFDVGGFYMVYGDRVGSLNQNGAVFRTNIGTSVSKGAEAFIEIDPVRALVKESKAGYVRLFVSYAYVNATYTTWNNPAIASDPSKSISGKKVENAPEHIARYGFTYNLKKFSATLQFNTITEVYTDAVNTEKPNAAATIGKIPGYTVGDFTATYLINEHFNVRAGVNNLTDEKYATRRAGGYPGPGLLPANGRTLFLSAGVKF